MNIIKNNNTLVYMDFEKIYSIQHALFKQTNFEGHPSSWDHQKESLRKILKINI